MKSILLPSGHSTSILGFGGTSLKGGASKRENLRCLSVAYEAGIRYFDVAPSYGFGVAESVLGEFARNKRENITITTKVGLPRPKNAGMLANLRSAVRPLVSFAPALRRFLGRSVQHMSGSSRTHFDMQHVRTSVEESFRELGTDYIDVLLLHEITPVDVTDELRSYLESLVASGRILNFGIGSYRHQAEATVHTCPDLASIMQTSWTPGDRRLRLDPFAPFLITHGSLRQMSKLQIWLKDNPMDCRKISEEIGIDLLDASRLPSLMLAAALANNTAGIVLVSSTKPARMQDHAGVACNEALLAKGKLFNTLLEARLLPV